MTRRTARLLPCVCPACPRTWSSSAVPSCWAASRSATSWNDMKRSAGILAYRWRNGEPELFLAHPGGPFWKNKDDGAWSIPKGEIGPDEDPLKAAQREFQEEIGQAI